MQNKKHGKTKAREVAFKGLYTYSLTNNLPETDDKIANKMIIGTIGNIKDIDEMIVKYLKRWSIDEINKVNLSILRLSIYEIKFLDTPKPIVVNEALNLTKKYSDLKSKNFVHHTLDMIIKGK